jgi:hypothetical protein
MRLWQARNLDEQKSDAYLHRSDAAPIVTRRHYAIASAPAVSTKLRSWNREGPWRSIQIHLDSLTAKGRQILAGHSCIPDSLVRPRPRELRERELVAALGHALLAGHADRPLDPNATNGNAYIGEAPGARLPTPRSQTRAEANLFRPDTEAARGGLQPPRGISAHLPRNARPPSNSPEGPSGQWEHCRRVSPAIYRRLAALLGLAPLSVGYH